MAASSKTQPEKRVEPPGASHTSQGPQRPQPVTAGGAGPFLCHSWHVWCSRVDLSLPGKEETKAAALSPESYTVVQVLGSENSSVELHGLKRVAWSENSNQSSSQVIHMPLEDKQKPQQMSVVQGTTVEESELTLVQKLRPTEDDQEPSPTN